MPVPLSTDPAAFVSLVAFSAVLAATPGPLTITLASIGARRGAGAGLRFLVGGAVAYGCVWALATLAVERAAAFDPRLFDACRAAGALVVLWIAWRIATCFEDVAGDRPVPGALTAVIATLANPKSWIGGAVAATAFADPSLPAIQVAAMHGGVIALVVLTCCSPWLIAGGAIGRCMRTAGRQRLLGRLSALALVGFTIPMLQLT